MSIFFTPFRYLVTYRLNTKMIWVTYRTFFLTWLTYSAAQISKGNTQDSSATCDEKWVFLDGFCYFFSDSEDTVNPDGASRKCILSDAEHAYPKSEKELAFMQSQAKARTTYGWAMNIKKDFYDDGFMTMQLSSGYGSITITPDAKSIPELQKSFDTDNKCVALHVGSRVSRYWLPKDAVISTEPCEVKLWVVCEGKLSNFPNQVVDYEKWFSNKKLMFWLSGKLANQADAKALCENEDMDLVTSVTDLMKALNGTYEITPWWTGLKLGKNGPENRDGTEVDLEVVSWLPESRKYGVAHIVLLHSGKARYSVSNRREESALPYICKKRAQANGLFGCPDLWIRGGRSCYSWIKSWSMNLQWSKAKEICEARGSHLLSIDSLDEKLWLDAVFAVESFSIWTSGNDIDVEGKFTWHGGSSIDNKILTWQKAPFSSYSLRYSDDCIEFNPKRDYIAGIDCDSTSHAACQYELREGETQCEDDWSKLDDICYFLDLKSDPMPYKLNKRRCMNILDDRSTYPLMVKTQRIADFIAKTYEFKSLPGYSAYFWLGLSKNDGLSSWRWYDHTLVDFSVFGKSDEPDNGDGDGPENCVALNSQLLAFDTSCDENKHFVCEKDLAPVSALPGSVSNLRVMIYIPTLLSLTNILLIHAL